MNEATLARTEWNRAARARPLDVFFEPSSVAVVGASEKAGSVGRAVFANLIAGPYHDRAYPINPKRASVLGVKAYPTIGDAPGPIDLAVIATPAASVPGVVGECARAGVKGAIILSAGFKEVGSAGAELERLVLDEARRGGVRLVGPNCLGVMRPVSGLNATFAAQIARPGSVGFLSQSGALCTAILDWSLTANVGFSAFVSSGSMLDVGWGDLIDYLGDDPKTSSILIYMESIGDARSFLSAAREVALAKPIIVIKAGRTDEAAKAAASHTGALAGGDLALDAAFRRVGVLRVDTIAEVFDMAEVLSKQPRPRGRRLAVVTNAGGPGVLAVDALIENKGALATLSATTRQALDAFLPDAWSRANPIDVLGDADAARYEKTLEIAAQDPDNDGLLVILTPQAMSDPTGTARALERFAKIPGKPVLASFMGGASVASAVQILDHAGVPTFAYPDQAARMFSLMWRSHYELQAIYETPSLPTDEMGAADARAAVETKVAQARGQGRTVLTEFESKEILTAYGIPTVETKVAHSAEEAGEIAEQMGFPVVLKLHSLTITHKTDVGGVQLNLETVDQVRSAYRTIETEVARRAGPGRFQGAAVQPMIKRDGYELILGSSLDPQLGPVLLFGSGGELVEVMKDRTLALPPLTSTLARRAIERTKIFQALKGVRGRPPVDLAALEHLLVRFSHLVVEQPWIKEIDLNPLLASHERLIALDARVIVHDAGLSQADLPRLAIRPYPSQYVASWTAGDQARYIIRPIRPEDEPLIVAFHGFLSERTVALRYFHPMSITARTAHERLSRICFIDYDRETALVAECDNASGQAREILGVSRLIKLEEGDAEFALVVADRAQGRGLGSELLRRLLQIARDERVARVHGFIIPENEAMKHVCRGLGFRLSQAPGDDVVLAEIEP